MSDDLLRRAAALMRDRAGAATPGPWLPSAERSDVVVSPESPRPELTQDTIDWYGGPPLGESMRRADVAHIAAWHPAVALAVADWLDDMASGTHLGSVQRGRAEAVARAYLGEPS